MPYRPHPNAPREQGRQLAPYGYCRFCGSPRPQGARFCGGSRCLRLDAADTVVGAAATGQEEAAAAEPTRATVGGRRPELTLPPARPVGATVRLAGASVDRRRLLVRDTSFLIVVVGLAVTVVLGVTGALRPQGGVLGATATPPPAATPAAATHPAPTPAPSPTISPTEGTATPTPAATSTPTTSPTPAASPTPPHAAETPSGLSTS